MTRPLVVEHISGLKKVAQYIKKMNNALVRPTKVIEFGDPGFQMSGGSKLAQRLAGNPFEFPAQDNRMRLGESRFTESRGII